MVLELIKPYKIFGLLIVLSHFVSLLRYFKRSIKTKKNDNMNLEGLQELLKEIEKVGMDHIDEEKFTGLLLDFTDKNCIMFDQG